MADRWEDGAQGIERILEMNGNWAGGNKSGGVGSI